MFILFVNKLIQKLGSDTQLPFKDCPQSFQQHPWKARKLLSHEGDKTDCPDLIPWLSETGIKQHKPPPTTNEAETTHEPRTRHAVLVENALDHLPLETSKAKKRTRPTASIGESQTGSPIVGVMICHVTWNGSVVVVVATGRGRDRDHLGVPNAGSHWRPAHTQLQRQKALQ